MKRLVLVLLAVVLGVAVVSRGDSEANESERICRVRRDADVLRRGADHELRRGRVPESVSSLR